MAHPAGFGGFYYDPASNLLAYRGVMAAISQCTVKLPLEKFKYVFVNQQLLFKK
jgi:hypothetical protein